MVPGLVGLAILAVLLARPDTSLAQTVVDPRQVQFNASPDHNEMRDGLPVVSSYELEFYRLGADHPFQSLDLGKPQPSDGRITVDLVSHLNSWPAPGLIYESRVAAVGPGGYERSGPSNTFSFSGPCAPTVEGELSSVGTAGASGSLHVSAGGDCNWSTSSTVDWIAIGPGGTGAGTVAYTIAPNTSSVVRTGSISVAERTYTIVQAGRDDCTYSITSGGRTFNASGGSADLHVATSEGCPLTFSAPGWISIRMDSMTSASYTVSPTSSRRVGAISIGSDSITIVQNGPSSTRIAVAAPSTTISQPFALSGWAVDLGAGAGTGITAVFVYAYPSSSTTPIYLGMAQYGQVRNDVTSQFGAQYTNSGYTFTVSGLATGRSYRLVAFALSSLTGTYKAATTTVTIPSALRAPGFGVGGSRALLVVESPQPGARVRVPFKVVGWAADPGAATGTGVNRVLVQARRVGSSSTLSGTATYGILRNDVSRTLGSRFARSGFTLTAQSLPTGTYDLIVTAYSSVTRKAVKTVTIRVNVTR
jgi:hypothetical protein